MTSANAIKVENSPDLFGLVNKNTLFTILSHTEVGKKESFLF